MIVLEMHLQLIQANMQFSSTSFSRFFFCQKLIFDFKLNFNFLLMEKLTAIYIWSIYQLRNRTTDGFLHDLGEDFGIMKIRLD